MAFPKKISDLPKAGSIKNSDLFVLVHNDVTSQVRFDRLIFSADSNTFVTGGTLSSPVLTLNRNDGGVINIPGFHSTFTGNTPSTCLSQLYANVLGGCSPIKVTSPMIFQGSTSGTTNISSSGMTMTKSGGTTTILNSGGIIINGSSGTTVVGSGGISISGSGITTVIGSAGINISGSSGTTILNSGGMTISGSSGTTTVGGGNIIFSGVSSSSGTTNITYTGMSVSYSGNSVTIGSGGIIVSSPGQSISLTPQGLSKGMTFTGNTEATCIDELWVTSISGCSPVILGPAVTVEGVFTIMGDAINDSGGNTPITFSGGNTNIGGDIILNSNSILDSEENTCIQFDGGGNTNISGDLDVQGQILSGGTNISTLWGEKNNWSPGTLTNIYYDGGKVGIGTNHPTEELHVLTSGGSSPATIKIEAEDANAFLVIESAAASNAFIDYKEQFNERRWRVGNHGTGDNFKWATGSTFGVDSVMTLSRDGDLEISGTLNLNGDIDLCPTGTIYCSSFSGCSPIHFHAPVEFDNSITVSADEEVVLDFSDANEILIPTYVLKHCKGTKSDIVTFQNFADYVGKIVTLASEEEGVKWEVTLQPTLEVTSIVDCCFDNYILTNCVTSEVYGIVNYEKWDGSSWVGTIIKIENDDGEFCYGVTTTCDAYDIDEKIEVVFEYETCSACTATTYSLFPCEDWEAEIINTITDLSDYVGTASSIKETETGICYTVMGCFAECEPAPPITYEGFPEGCIDCLDNHILTNCMTGAYIGTTTTQSPLWEPEIVFSASNISGCFTVEPAKQAADISSIENIGVMENCETWPCNNFILWNCDGGALGISSQNLTEFVDGPPYSGTNVTHSFSGQCFSIESITEDADLGPLDTSDWGMVECETWPCANYMITPCTEGVLGITVRQDLSDYVFDVSGYLTGTTFEESFCFTVELTFDPPTEEPINISSWGSLGVEIEDCSVDPPCQE